MSSQYWLCRDDRYQDSWRWCHWPLSTLELTTGAGQGTWFNHQTSYLSDLGGHGETKRGLLLAFCLLTWCIAYNWNASHRLTLGAQTVLIINTVDTHCHPLTVASQTPLMSKLEPLVRLVSLNNHCSHCFLFLFSRPPSRNTLTKGAKTSPQRSIGGSVWSWKQLFHFFLPFWIFIPCAFSPMAPPFPKLLQKDSTYRGE